MKILPSLLAVFWMLAGTCLLDALLPVPPASAQFVIDFGRVRARQNRQSNIWEIVNSTNSTMMVRYGVAMRGTSDYRSHKLVIPPKSTRMLGYDLNTYDLKITTVNKLGY